MCDDIMRGFETGTFSNDVPVAKAITKKEATSVLEQARNYLTEELSAWNDAMLKCFSTDKVELEDDITNHNQFLINFIAKF